MPEFIRDSAFETLSGIHHAFFTRKGGVSSGVYASLNCNISSSDAFENVQENRSRALHTLDLPLEAMITVNMVHGNRVAIIDETWARENIPEADAMVTKEKNAVLASDSADCPIVLLADEHAEIIGLAHAGWKSAKSGIIENTIQEMVLLGAQRNHIAATIGPCISKNSYEVSDDFYKQFLLEYSENHIYFTPSTRQDHFMFDLLQFVWNKLEGLSIQSISAVGLDTYTNEDLFFSYRRSCHQRHSDFGGHLSCIYFER